MKRAVFAIVLSISWVTYSQVHIRENVAISPGKFENVQSIVDHSLRFVFAWDKGGSCSGLYIPVSPCGEIPPESVHYYTDSMVVDLRPGRAGHYAFDPQYCVASINPWETANLVFSIYVDDVLFSRQSAAVNGSTENVRAVWPNGWINFTTPYRSSFGFFIQSKKYYGDPYVAHVYGIDNCDTSTWSSHTEPVTLTIVSGGQYASLHKIDSQTDVKMGNTITAIGDDIGGYALVMDGVPADSSAEWVVVEAKSNGMTQRDSAIIPSPPVVTITPPELSTGEMALVDVKWRNPDGTLRDYASVPWFAPGTWNFEAGIWSGEEYGMIGLEGVGIWDYKNFIDIPFWLLAADELDSDSVMVGIRVGSFLTMLSLAAPGDKGRDMQASTVGGVKPGVDVDGDKVRTEAKRPSFRTSVSKGGSTVLSREDFKQPNYGIGWVKVSNKRKGCPVVSLSAGSMMTGDTVTVTIAEKLEDGTIVPYPAGTEFILNLVKGESYGTLVGSGGKGTTITSTLPIRFIANDEIDVSSAVVTVHAEVSAGGVSASKKSVVKPMAETCEPAEASVSVHGIRDCSNSYLGFNLPKNRLDKAPGHCLGTGGGAVAGGYTYYDWPPQGKETTTLDICVDKSSGDPRYRETLSTVGLYIEYGVCTDNLPGRLITDLASISDDQLAQVIDDFNAQIDLLENTMEPVKGEYSFIDAYVAHENAHVPFYQEELIKAAEHQNAELLNNVISVQWANEVGKGGEAYHDEVSKIMMLIRRDAENAVSAPELSQRMEFQARKKQAEALSKAVEQLLTRIK